ncbi:unnamed protein product [Didymodactylos carnosus]|uniref:Tetraspanin n=1 Tax=Didymodactylos carnosus TaxID=1234261 RepID=A0A814L4M8_9BILA|nr:unnamed protein product [Didymodactylos carnosus]CAF1060162.1 unnamed protein product [Didymodactylos carnosus]CAF3633340.1 unnamed protein product [Didymodactylos carnosus]CAF3828537.1 unnamed protein product [Didymodactylos carnosus]
MRAHKLLFLIFLVLYFIAGLCLLITGSVAHSHAKQYAEITGHSLMGGAGFIIALGVIILLLCIVGFIGAWKNHLKLLTCSYKCFFLSSSQSQSLLVAFNVFIVSLGLILLLQLIAAIVAFTLRNKADERLRAQLITSMKQYDKNERVTIEWDRVQSTYECCGTNSKSDWNATSPPKNLPLSCCKEHVCTPDNNIYTTGCYEAARKLFYRYSAALGGVAIFFFFIEIIGFILAITLLRDLKNNYGSV